MPNSTTPEQSTKIDRIKKHIVDHKEAYIAAIGGIAVGAIAVYLLKSKQTVIINQVMPQINPVFNNTVNNGGHMRKIVRCIETGELWLSVSQAAQSAEVSLPKMSQHINGHKDHVNGLHYVVEALAAG